MMTSRPLVVGALICVLAAWAWPATADEAKGSAGEAAAEDPAPSAAAPAETGAPEDIQSRRIFDKEAQQQTVGAVSPPYVEMIKLAASLAIVLGLVAAAAWGLRRLMPRTSSMFSSETVKVLARSYLGPRQMICLVSVGGKLLVVGSTQTSVATLAEIDDPEEVERIRAAVEAGSSHSATRTFKTILSTVTGRRVKDAGFEADVAAAVSEVSDRVAVLNRKLEAYESDLN
jgi:flagellar biosynthetic protein FliO